MSHHNFEAGVRAAGLQRIFLVEDSPLLRDALIDRIVRVEPQHLSPSRIENQFAERDATQLLIFIQQPGNQLVYWRVSCSRSRGLRRCGG